MEDNKSKLVGGFVRMEVSLGSVVNLIMLVVVLGGAITAYDNNTAVQAKSQALLAQKFDDFESMAEAQLTTVSAQTASVPLTAARLESMASRVRSLRAKVDTLSERIGVLERAQAAMAAELDDVLHPETNGGGGSGGNGGHGNNREQ